MHISRKHILQAVALLVIVAVCLAVALATRQRTLNIAFHGVTDATKDAVTKMVTQHLESKAMAENHQRPAFKVQTSTLTSDSPIEKQLTSKPKPDLLIAIAGYATDTAANLAMSRGAGISDGCIATMPQTVAASANRDSDRLVAVPLLLDHYEIAVNRAGDGTQNFLFAGGDDRTLLALAGAITEARFGADAARQLLNDCRQHNPREIPALQDAAKAIAQAINAGDIPESALTIVEEELAIHMSNGSPNAVFMPLSYHRTLPHESLRKYDSRFLAAESQSNRALTAPVLYGVPLSTRKATTATLESLLTALTSSNAQAELSKSTGLVPVHANAQTPDIQADDVRYWVAASSPPLPSLGDAFNTTAERSEAASSFRNMILEHVHTDAR